MKKKIGFRKDQMRFLRSLWLTSNLQHPRLNLNDCFCYLETEDKILNSFNYLCKTNSKMVLGQVANALLFAWYHSLNSKLEHRTPRHHPLWCPHINHITILSWCHIVELVFFKRSIRICLLKPPQNLRNSSAKMWFITFHNSSMLVQILCTQCLNLPQIICIT